MVRARGPRRRTAVLPYAGTVHPPGSGPGCLSTPARRGPGRRPGAIGQPAVRRYGTGTVKARPPGPGWTQ
eukprot:755991-Hanusia_phi.AAC.1